jgi:exosome complex RNA-binding protein Csl4
LSVQSEEGKIKLDCPECQAGTSSVVLERVKHLPKNLALLNVLEVRKNNTSSRSINSLKDESFSVPRINRSYQEEDEDEALMTAINGKETHSEQEHC